MTTPIVCVAAPEQYPQREASGGADRALCACQAIPSHASEVDKAAGSEIFNTDQGSQLTCDPFTRVRRDAEVTISMDSKGLWMDNVSLDRPRHALKCKEVYLYAYAHAGETWAVAGPVLSLLPPTPGLSQARLQHPGRGLLPAQRTAESSLTLYDRWPSLFSPDRLPGQPRPPQLIQYAIYWSIATSSPHSIFLCR